jgi:SRSO17 transposase
VSKTGRRGRSSGRSNTAVRPKGDDGLLVEPMHLIVLRDILDPDQTKFFVCNAAPETPIQTILLMAFSRWKMECCFEDHNGEVALDHQEGRQHLELKRDLILSAVSYLFLA